LIELLAVIIILVVIALITIPIALNVIDNVKKNAFKSTAYGLIDAAKLQAAENFFHDQIEDLSYTFPEAEGLRYSGETPKGGTLRYTKEGKTSIAIHNGQWCVTKGLEEEDVTILKYEEGKCILKEDADIPVLTLKGNEPIYIGIGSTYQEPGYSVKTVGGEELSNDLVQITIKGQNTGNTTLDTSIEETYTITYTVEYKGNSSTKTRTVHVGNYNPSIEITPNGTSKYSKAMDVNIKVQAYEKLNINSFTYTLIKDGVEQTPIIVNKTSETITLDQDGIYTIKVEAIDSENNSSSLISEPYKIDVTPPTITMSNVTITSAQAPSYNLMTGVTVADNSGITPTVTTSGSLSSTAKTYTITYTVTDEAGNVTIRNRSIIVAPSMADQLVGKPDTMTNDPDGNLRYVGSNPNNYVKFNNELWRIIGVFNGQVKLIRNDPYSVDIAFDKGETDGGVHGKYGWNDWAQSTLQQELNTVFLGNIDNTSKSYIDDRYVWNLGGVSGIGPGSDYTRSYMYIHERGKEVYSGRPIKWRGAIGLMYPSDYAYSTDSTNSVCDTFSVKEWHDSDFKRYCIRSSWLYNEDYTRWTITPDSSFESLEFVIYSSGNIEGSGTSSSPYELGI